MDVTIARNINGRLSHDLRPGSAGCCSSTLYDGRSQVRNSGYLDSSSSTLRQKTGDEAHGAPIASSGWLDNTVQLSAEQGLVESLDDEPVGIAIPQHHDFRLDFQDQLQGKAGHLVHIARSGPEDSTLLHCATDCSLKLCLFK